VISVILLKPCAVKRAAVVTPILGPQPMTARTLSSGGDMLLYLCQAEKDGILKGFASFNFLSRSKLELLYLYPLLQPMQSPSGWLEVPFLGQPSLVRSLPHAMDQQTSKPHKPHCSNHKLGSNRIRIPTRTNSKY
jgi:hypothetical protein